MLVALGLDVDPTFASFVDRALEADIPVQAINLRALVDGDWRFEMSTPGTATLQYGDSLLQLRPEDTYFCRIIDMSYRAEPELRSRWISLTSGLQTWLEFVPGLVVNRWRCGTHNGSKPLHEAILQELGFRVPESVTTIDIGEILKFVRAGRTISKPVCGVRADSAIVSEEDFAEFEPSSGPIHLQRFVGGSDARIHVVGDRIVAQRVSADVIDYRRAGAISDMQTFEAPKPLQDLLIEGTRALGLEFAGWDFKIDDDSVYWCLEANPMPGYSPYDDHCDGAIARELLGHLMDGSRKI